MRRFVYLSDRHDERMKKEDRRAGELWALYATTHRDAQKRPQGYTWLDLFPEHKPVAEEQTDEEMLQAMMLWAKALPVQKPS